MNKLFGLAIALALPNFALASEPYFEFELGASRDFRSGDELNESGTGRELSEFSLANIEGLAAYTFENGLLIQGGLQFDRNFADSTLDGLIPTNDTYREGHQISLQAGRQFDRHYLGVYAVAGHVAFNPFDDDQDAKFHSLGLQMAWYGDDWQMSGSLGYLDSRAEDPETIANAVVLGATAAYDLSADTRLSGTLTFIDGEQDIDSGSAPDPVKVLSVGAELEHTLRQTSFGSLAAYGGISVINVWEESSSSATDHVNDKIISAGIRMRFGANSANAADRRSSPPLPEMLRLLGAVPAVD